MASRIVNYFNKLNILKWFCLESEVENDKIAMVMDDGRYNSIVKQDGGSSGPLIKRVRFDMNHTVHMIPRKKFRTIIHRGRIIEIRRPRKLTHIPKRYE